MQYNDIHVRKLRFEFNDVHKCYWNNNCPVRSHIFSSLSIIIPSFERMVIASVLPFKDKVKCPETKKQLVNFVKQEALHSSGFTQYNQFLQKYYPASKLEKISLGFFRSVAFKCKPITHLAFTVGGEHIAAIFSDITLRDNLFAKAIPKMQRLWNWHAIEEIEHKSVAMDIYNEQGGGYFRRVFAMLFISIACFFMLMAGFIVLMYKDKQLFKFKTFKELFVFLFWREKFMLKMLWQYIAFFMPRFHPWHKDNSHLVRYWQKVIGR